MHLESCSAVNEVRRSTSIMRLAKLAFALLLGTCAWSA